jgi:hypothetical protein
MIKSRRTRWAGHSPRIEEMGSAYKIYSEIFIERDHLRNTGVDGKII